MKRTTGRKLAMQALYQSEIQKKDMETVLIEFIDKSRYIEETKNWTKELALGTAKHQVEIDKMIKESAIGWEINRMNPIDLSLLRLGLFEMKFYKTPSTIVINEILEIAKKYATDDSPKFLNGILGKFA
jgi:N utilization substance protein B